MKCRIGIFFLTVTSILSASPVETLPLGPSEINIPIKQVFLASPLIYSLLLFLSVSSLAIWIQVVFSFRRKQILPTSFVKIIKVDIIEGNFELALEKCQKQKTLLAKLLSAPMQLREHGLPLMIDAVKAEGKRATNPFWQKLSLLNDIAVIAPMLGLLGTVLGMFYAFYDINRSLESISSLFDGLGIAVGTTVVGLIVALFAMLLSTTLKHKLISTLTLVENEAMQITHLMQIKPKPRKKVG